jgi:Putative zinc-finger
MNCADAEILICDYVDGTLAAPARAEVERHLAECAACAGVARDAAEAIQLMERAAAAEPPQELISRILFDPPWHKHRGGWFTKAVHAALQPRFAMGMALTVLSFAMIMPKMRQLQPTDLSPVAVWSGIEGRVERLWERTEKFYDNLRFIYQIRATLREWQQQSQETGTGPGVPRSRAEKSPTEQRRVPVPDGPLPVEQGPAGKP